MPEYALRLEVVNGPLKGQVALVQDHATLIVGRLPDCGLAIPQDLTVSRQHFRIEFNAPRCRLIHLSQTGETHVNGTPVGEIDLKRGDEIAFGEANKAIVSFEEHREGIAGPTIAVTKSGSSTVTDADGFTCVKASCGWNLYESPNKYPDFNRLLDILMESQYVCAMVDFKRLQAAVPAEVADPPYLFPWMPSPVREQMSPILVSVSGNSEIGEIIRAGWEKDGIICFGSNLKDDEAIAHWKKAIGSKGDQPGATMTAYFWPSILNVILTCQSPDDVAVLLNELTWIFIEAPKSPGKWRLFSKDDLAPVLTKAGLVPLKPPAPAK